MQHNSDIIISDTSCLILLDKIEMLDLLKLLSSQVYITSTIKAEFGKDLPDWISVKNPKDTHYQQILEVDLDKGEASAIALSLDLDSAILIIDDLKGRKMAQRLGLRFSGTLGLIIKARQTGKIDSVRPIIDKIKQTNFRFSESLLGEVIQICKD